MKISSTATTPAADELSTLEKIAGGATIGAVKGYAAAIATSVALLALHKVLPNTDSITPVVDFLQSNVATSIAAGVGAVAQGLVSLSEDVTSSATRAGNYLATSVGGLLALSVTNYVLF